MARIIFTNRKNETFADIELMDKDENFYNLFSLDPIKLVATSAREICKLELTEYDKVLLSAAAAAAFQELINKKVCYFGNLRMKIIPSNIYDLELNPKVRNAIIWYYFEKSVKTNDDKLDVRNNFETLKHTTINELKNVPNLAQKGIDDFVSAMAHLGYHLSE